MKKLVLFFPDFATTMGDAYDAGYPCLEALLVVQNC